MRRLVSSMIASMLAAGCVGDAPEELATEDASEAIVVGTIYTLTGVQSGKCVQFAATSDLAEAQLATCDGSTRQQWRFEDVGGGFHRIRNVASDKCLDVEGVSRAVEARIIQWPCGNGANQQWSIRDSGGIVRLSARHSGLAADAFRGGTAEGTKLVQTTPGSGASQQFRASTTGGAFACNGDTSGYDVVVTTSGPTWVARRGSTTLFSGTDMRAAIQAGIDGLTSGRTTKQSVLVQGSGSMAANTRINLASYTILNVCGTIHVTGSGSGDMAPIYARGRRDIDIPNVSITGSPVYGMFFRQVSNLRLGKVNLRLSGGLGIRIDNGSNHPPTKVSNIRIDHVHAEGTGSHAVETYGVDDIEIGSIVARKTGECGLLLNDTTNAEVGMIDAEDAGTGTGYAAFRIANRAGRIGDVYPTNIHVGEIVSRRGGRGIFCVSESGGLTVDRLTVEDAGNNSILLENCYNVRLATQRGTVTRGGEIRLSARSSFANSRDITLQNLTVRGTSIRESPCADDSSFVNITRVDAPMHVCN